MEACQKTPLGVDKYTTVMTQETRERSVRVVPVIHVPGDLGSLGRRVHLNPEVEDSIVRYWNRVSTYVQSLPIDFSKLWVYQDGLPDGSDDDIACIFNSPLSRTPNYDLLRRLESRGAHIVGTEDKGLLLKELSLAMAEQNALAKLQTQIGQGILSESEENRYVAEYDAACVMAKQRYEEETPMLSKKRLEYIVQRIHSTLPQGGTGLLFLGLAHDIEGLLVEKGIKVIGPPEELTGLSPKILRAKIGVS